MKKLFSTFAQGMLFMALALVLTGCDELLYLKDNPVTPRLNVRSNSITLKVGATASCEASTQDHVALFYASADPAVATVDAKGTITGVAVGKTKITVTAKGDDDYYRTQIFGESTQVIDVEVVPSKVDVESIKLDQTTLNKEVGDAAVTLTVTFDPAEPTDKTVTWKSSDESVATVADGVVTFVAAGTATITATATNGTSDTSDDKTADCTVKVMKNLANLTADYIAKNGDILTGTLAGNYKISIKAGATVTLYNVTINGSNNNIYQWAGINPEGDATIILEGANTVKGFWRNYPGIHSAVGHTLTIKGTGSLNASSNGWGAGIGGGKGVSCGNIVIQSGTIVATGGINGAGIGSGKNDGGSDCGDITISGGTITATGGNNAAGIGIANGTCGNIEITAGVTSVTATYGGEGFTSIKVSTGKTIKFGSVTVYDGATWNPAAMVSGNYGGLNLTVSSKTWTLVP